ncbi:MAG: DUF389 domain-containing protein [Cyanobacteria bacterium P01_C01_bin.89]
MRLYRSMAALSPEDCSKMCTSLMEDAALNLDYLVLAICACLIATVGLLVGSAATIIGAMIVAPLVMPMRGVAMGAVQGDWRLLRQGLISVFVGAILSIALAAIAQLLIRVPASAFGPEILNRTQPNLADLAVAIVAGAVCGFARIRPKLSDALAGTAIAVALMPPLCVVGINLAVGQYQASRGAFLLYLTNLLGIILACMAVFVLNGYHVSFRRTSRALAFGMGFTALTIFPLFQGFSTLMNQVRIRDGLREILQRETITVGQQMELLDVRIDWNELPFQVNLYVESDQPVTPTQVQAVEDYLHQRLRRSQRTFALKFLVKQFSTVQGSFRPYLAGGHKRIMDDIRLQMILKRRFDRAMRPIVTRWDLVGSKIDWETRDPTVTVTVKSEKPLILQEVRSFEQSLEEQMAIETRTRFKVQVQRLRPS